MLKGIAVLLAVLNEDVPLIARDNDSGGNSKLASDNTSSSSSESFAPKSKFEFVGLVWELVLRIAFEGEEFLTFLEEEREFRAMSFREGGAVSCDGAR
jgi:hypothetical protein